MSNGDPQNILNLFVALLALFASKEVAYLAGPYAAIAVLACAGAMLSLTGNDKVMTNLQAMWYVSIRVALAISLTVGIAELLNLMISWAKPRYTLIPLAFAFGFIRDYDQVRGWLGSLIDRFAAKKIDNIKPDP